MAPKALRPIRYQARKGESTSRWGSGIALAASVGLAAGAAQAWTPLAVDQDPLVRLPGTQPGGASLDGPSSCLGCHDDYDANVNPGFHWRGSMMSQAMRDPIFWATMVVAAQDSIWAAGRPNGTDLCLRCHSPGGWLAGRSDPTNATLMVGSDFDGVFCEGCHKLYDPFFEDTYAGLREGSDWLGYWDETDLSGTPSSLAAFDTLLEDETEAAFAFLFNGNAFYDGSFQPVQTAWDEASSGQFFVADSQPRRAPYADAEANHQQLYSRFHKSKYFCGTCHDVSNPIFGNLPFDGTPPGDLTTVLPSESQPAYAYGHVERTFSEFMLSDYGLQGGSPGVGPYDPASFTTSRPGNAIASCQDCHMPDTTGKACDKNFGIDRPGGSTEHPNSGQPLHDLTGGNMWVPYLLASAVPGSPNYDANNSGLLTQGPALLTLDLTQGLGLEPLALLDAVNRAHTQLQNAAAIENLDYVAATGLVTFRIRNHTGHKLISGYPEGRRMFANVRVYDNGALVHEINPYDPTADTLKGLASPSSPALGAGEAREDAIVYEIKQESTLTGEAETFHFVLGTGRVKDNRIPPKGFRIAEADTRIAEPVTGGVVDPGYFTAAEYAGGWDDVQVTVPTGADGVEVRLFYQTISREYAEFLRDEINGVNPTLSSPTPSGEPNAYVAQTDPWFSQLAAWGDTMWSLWDINRDVPGAAPVLMTDATFGNIGPQCGAGSDGQPCDDDDMCTTVDTCLSGVCTGGTPVICMASDQCHDVGVCDAMTGTCSDPELMDGTGCDDGDLCTTVDACQAGVCTGTTPVVCMASDECHDPGTCNGATGVCSDPPKTNGAPCSIGTCVNGICEPGSGGMGGTPVGGMGGVPVGGMGGTPVGGMGGVPVGGMGGVSVGGMGGTPVGGMGGTPVGGMGGVPVGGMGTGGSAVGGMGGEQTGTETSTGTTTDSGTGTETGTGTGTRTGTTTDSGTGTGAGSGGEGVGASGEGDAGADSGCGCRLHDTSDSERTAWVVWLSLGAVLSLRRRRRFDRCAAAS